MTVTFSEPVSGFTLGGITVANGTASGFSGSDGDDVYTFDVTPDSLDEVTVDIAAGVATDGEGNGNTAAPSCPWAFPTISTGVEASAELRSSLPSGTTLAATSPGLRR